MGISGPVEPFDGAFEEAVQNVPQEFTDAGYTGYACYSDVTWIEVDQNKNSWEDSVTVGKFDTIGEFEAFVTQIVDNVRALAME